jgi:hypothetical protein
MYGVTYVHAPVRNKLIGCIGINAKLNEQIVSLTFTSYGRSLQYGGHKYKAHARFVATNKPVPSKQLNQLAPL